MKKENIIEYFENNGLSDIDELKEGNGFFLARIYYDFDKDELKSARAYANDESDEDEESDVWFSEFFLPYLNELAVDNVGEVIEECMEEFEISIQFVSYDLGIDEYSYNEFIVLVHENDVEADIDELMN